MKPIVLFGVTGFIGKKLVQTLVDHGYAIVVFTRNAESARNKLPAAVQVEEWDGKSLENQSNVLSGCEAIVSLCGEGIAAKRWTDERKKELLESRVNSTRAIAEAIKKMCAWLEEQHRINLKKAS